MLKDIFDILVFPGLLFLFVLALFAEFADRKFCARLQNRKGPPWFQPLADFIKLLGKEDLIPAEADITIFKFMPILALTTTVAASFHIPLWKEQALSSFDSDLIVVLYLLTVPTLTFFLAGWYSRSVYAMIGAARSLTQIFAYEVPLFMSLLALALLANTWSISGITVFYSKHTWLLAFNIIGFGIALVCLLGKLEKVPFDIPEAETEVVAGTFTEYSGRLLALFRITLDIEMVVAAALLAAVYLPFGLNYCGFAGFIIFIVKIIFIVFLISLLRSVMARLRLDQMINFCWKYLAPLACLQILINLILKIIVY